MSTIAVIPARYGSTRFCGKPLAKETGKFLIQHVCERVQSAPSIQQVIVATDDERIRDAVHSFGARCAMTSPAMGPSRNTILVTSYTLTLRIRRFLVPGIRFRSSHKPV